MRNNILLVIILTLIFVHAWFTSIHSCKYPNCPYKGITKYTPQNAECEEGSDCYIYDSLHIQYPNKSYDELEEVYDAGLN